MLHFSPSGNVNPWTLASPALWGLWGAGTHAAGAIATFSGRGNDRKYSVPALVKWRIALERRKLEFKPEGQGRKAGMLRVNISDCRFVNPTIRVDWLIPFGWESIFDDDSLVYKRPFTLSVCFTRRQSNSTYTWISGLTTAPQTADWI